MTNFDKNELIYISEQFSDRLKEEPDDDTIASIVDKANRALGWS